MKKYYYKLNYIVIDLTNSLDKCSRADTEYHFP